VIGIARQVLRKRIGDEIPLVLLVGGFISILALLAYGINSDHYLTYNLLYQDIFSNPEKYRGTVLEIILVSPVLEIFSKVFAPILTTPEWMVVFAILANALVLTLCFKIIRTVISKKDAVLFILLLGILINGYFIGIDNTQLSFDRKVVATIAGMFGILGLLNKRYWWGQFAVCCGLALHTLDTIGLMVFFYPALLIYTYMSEKRQLSRLLVSFVPVIITTIWILVQQNEIGIARIPVETGEWFKFVVDVERTDVLLYPNVIAVGWFGLPLVGIGVLLSVQKSTKSLLDWLCLTLPGVMILAITVEMIHQAGITFGSATELFTGLQIRRGLWFVWLVYLFRIFAYVSDAKDKPGGKISFYGFLAGVLVHSIVGMVLAVGCVLYLYRKKLNEKALFYLTLGLLGGIGIWYSVSASTVLGGSELKKALVCCFLWIAMMLAERFWSTNRIACFGVVLYACVMIVNNNFLNNNRVFSDEYTRVFAVRENQIGPAEAWWYVAADEKRLEELQLLADLNQLSKRSNGGVLFLGTETGYATPIILNKKTLFSRWDNSSMFSKKFYENYRARLADFGISDALCNLSSGAEGIACVQGKVADQVDRLGFGELQQIAKKYKLDYIVRREPLPIEEAFRTRSYYVYYFGP
jgi:hypothetical protein